MIRNFIKKNHYEYYEEVNLYKYNTYRLNVIAKYLVFPKSVDELIDLLGFIKDYDYKYLVLGNGSNVIFKEDYYDGVVIKLDRLRHIEFHDDIVEVEAGYPLMRLAMETAQRGLSGLEFASAIPGYVGASAAMNAGAYKCDISDILIDMRVVNSNLELVTISKGELEYRYRDSFIKENKDYIVVSCRLKLTKGDREQILKLISERRVRRIQSQPLDFPSAGSVFRNPDGMYAGELIENCGLKGFSVGGAMVSNKHANFIVNTGSATGKDIITLIEKIQSEVYDRYHVHLILEQIIIE